MQPLIAKNAKRQIKLKLMQWKALRVIAGKEGREGEGDGLLVHLEQAVHSENSYGLPITVSHYRRLMSTRVAG